MIASVGAHEPDAARAGLARSWPRALRALAAGLSAVFAAALVTFVTAHPSVEASFPARQPHPTGLHDLVSFEYGPLVVASSYEASGHHHPAFLVDRRPRPTPLEKWASDPSDRRPWVELRWGEPREVAEVVILQGAAYERARAVARRMVLVCLVGGGRAGARTVDDATPVTRAALPCEGATGIRLEFSLLPGADLVSLYEVEVWGR